MNEALIGSILIAIVLIVILSDSGFLYPNCPPGHSHWLWSVWAATHGYLVRRPSF